LCVIKMLKKRGSLPAPVGSPRVKKEPLSSGPKKPPPGESSPLKKKPLPGERSPLAKKHLPGERSPLAKKNLSGDSSPVGKKAPPQLNDMLMSARKNFLFSTDQVSDC
jgi:hypothetical protein